jgi:YD repeat-containing protein
MRYIYDLTQGGSVSIPGATFRAYGNLAITQEYLPVDISHPPWSWKPLKATAFDAADRGVADYAFAPGASTAYATTQSYDGAGQAGLLSSKTDALNQIATYSYDGAGRQSAVQYQNASSPTYSKQFTFDANGRHLTEASGLFGTQTSVYDWTGVLLTRSIPAYGPIPAATLRYEYYPDGMAKDINATVASLSQTTPLETWAYRADGRRASTILNYANKAYTLSESYTSAGRPQTSTDNFRTTSATYDASGQMSSLVLPAGPFTGIAHDPEGALTSYTGYQNYFPPSGTTITNSLTVRGELLGQSYAPDFAYDHTPLTPSHTAVAFNGYIDSGFNGIDIWDVRTKMPLSQWGDPGDTGQSLAYDTVGRLVSSNDGWTGWNSNGNEIEHSGSYTKAYDAENHLVSQSLTNYNLQGAKTCPGDWSPSPPGPNWPATVTGSVAYVWNVDDHPWIINGAGVIWNGDEPFISVNNGAIATIRIDNRAVLQPGPADPLAVLDRDMSGEAVSFHDSTGVLGLTLPGRYHSACGSPIPGSTTTRSGGLGDPIDEPRADGIWDGVNMIQGVRNYDTAIGKWTTPDAYKGNIHDPMSQQAYMWNRNNPYVYSDPSGFDTITIYARNADHLSESHTFIEVLTDATKGHPSRRIRYSFGPADEKDPLGSRLVRKDQNYDARYAGGRDTWGRTELAHCVGTCTKANGGFDEASLEKTAAAIDKAGVTYRWFTSNNATYTECVAGGGNCTLPPGFWDHGAFGWGFPIPIPSAGQKG